ncbi:MAG: PKD domain-containing protein, partial [Methanoregulaceae archaeon]
GNTSDLQNPQHTYTTPGNYTVNLTVTNDCGEDSVSKVNIVTAEPCILPVADFTADPESGPVPLTVQFTDTSSGGPHTWSWEFGDGNTSDLQNPQHTYTTPGNYTVNLTVTNDCGEDSVSKVNIVTAEPCILPVADFTAEPNEGPVPLTVQFTDTSSGGPHTWSWEFGDGTTNSSQNPQHTYTTPGNYTVNLTVTNDCGEDSVSKVNIVTAEPCVLPVADFTADPESGPVPLTVQFTDTSLNNPTSWSWEFGDGYASGQPNPQHTYGAQGSYTVTLTVSNECGFNTTSKPNVITAGPSLSPIADFTADPTSGFAPLTVNFTDTSLNNPTSWLWAFGDGATSILRDPVHLYVYPGVYSVNLTASNAAGTGSIVKQNLITVFEPIPPLPHSFYGNITLYGDPAPVNTTIDAQVLGGNGSVITSEVGKYGGGADNNLTVQGWIQDGWAITFSADGEPAECRDVVAGGDWEWNYPYKAGTHTNLDLRVTGEQPPPIADFTANQTTGPAPLTVQFTDTSAHNPTSWSWAFGDGGTSSLKDPVHTYTAPGFYTVNLTATNAAGDSFASKTDYIHVQIIIGGDRGWFNIICNEDDAEVWFDQDFKGLTGDDGTLLVPVYLTTLHYSTYTVAKDGFYTVTDNLPAYPAKDEIVDIYVTLEPIPPADFYYINASVGNVGGIIQPPGIVEVPAGGSQNFTLTPASGYTFDRLLVDDALVQPVYTYRFENVIQNHTIIVYFKVTGGGGGGGGNGGSVVVPTNVTTVPTTAPTPDSSVGENGLVNVTPTPEETIPPTFGPGETTPVPTTIAPAQPFWSRFPLAWLIPIILLILILAALAYYYYKKEQKPELFEEE